MRPFSVFLCSVRRLLVTANVVPSSPILVALMMEALCSSETSVFTRATRRNIPEDGILNTQMNRVLVSVIGSLWKPYLVCSDAIKILHN
jgi:hypothetical protein